MLSTFIAILTDPQSDKNRNLKRTQRRGAFSRSLQQSVELVLHFRPLRSHDRIPDRIARNVVGGHPVSTEDPFKLSADALQRGPRALITSVGVKANTQHLPDLKGV